MHKIFEIKICIFLTEENTKNYFLVAQWLIPIFSHNIFHSFFLS